MTNNNLIKDILFQYNYEIPAIRSNLYRIFNHGKLSNTGKLIILPVDQGFEHGPDASFAYNPSAYDPLYHVNLAIDAGVNAYAAPLGMLEIASNYYAGEIPMILKLNSSNSLKSKNNEPYQAITASPRDALRLGCVGVGLTIYPGSNNCDTMLEQAQNIFYEAKNLGLVCVLWTYPRGHNIENDTLLSNITYGAHIGALIGAHIIKVKLPTEDSTQQCQNLEAMIKHVIKCAFNGKRIVVFSGGTKKDDEVILQEVLSIKNGGGNGIIMGRNLFQRTKENALCLVDKIVKILI